MKDIANRRNRIAIFFCAIVLLAMLIHTVRLLAEEDLIVTKNSYAYFIVIRSSTIKDFPVVNKEGVEYYYSSAGDGNKPPAEGIRYTTGESFTVLLRRLEDYIVSKGYKKDESLSEGKSLYFTGSSGSFELLINEEANATHKVIATEYYK